MAHALSDEEAGLQILGIFVRNKVQASGTLRRIHFFDVRDGDFQRGINHAVASRWITVHHRDRYRYILTEEGYAAGRQTDRWLPPRRSAPLKFDIFDTARREPPVPPRNCPLRIVPENNHARR